MKKKVLNPRRIRRIPTHFSWVDHRLIRKRLLARCSSESWALYLFLITVADAQGISYYSEHSICEHSGLSPSSLSMARKELLVGSLIAWQSPFYQVLELPEDTLNGPVCVSSQPREMTLSIGALLKSIGEGDQS